MQLMPLMLLKLDPFPSILSYIKAFNVLSNRYKCQYKFFSNEILSNKHVKTYNLVYVKGVMHLVKRFLQFFLSNKMIFRLYTIPSFMHILTDMCGLQTQCDNKCQ